MPQPPAPDKKKRQRLIIMGGAGVLLLLFLYMRSQGGSSASTNATNASDVQTAVDNAVTQQQQADAAMYGYGSYGTGGTGSASSPTDLTPVTSGLTTLDSDLQSISSQLASGTGTGSAAAAPTASTPAGSSPPITINVGASAQPGKSTSAAVRMSTLTAAQKAAGIIAAPFGSKKPPGDPSGYSIVGLGSGNWGYKPVAAPAKTGKTSATGARLTIKK